MNKRFYLISAIIIALGILSIFIFNSAYSASEPGVKTNEAAIKTTSVTLKGVIKDTGGKKITVYGFKWGTTKELGQDKKLNKSIAANKTYSATISGLKPGTTYYYQAYAANSKGLGYGDIKTFKVPKKHNDAPVVTISKPSGNIAVSRGEKVSISANAQDDDKVYGMELFINNLSMTKTQNDSLSFEWNTGDADAGNYAIKVTAWDGNDTGEKSVTISVKNAPSSSPAAISTTKSVSRGSTSGSHATPSARYPRLSKVNGSFGQFAYRDLSGGRIEIDPNWIARNIVTITLPGLNRQVQVNKAAAPNFIYAFNLIKNGTAVVNGRTVPLLSLIDTMDGTFVTRHVNWNPARGLSNHSWGTAIDINASGHFGYVDSSDVNDPNLILWEKAFKPAGFSWGNRYSDSMHYELIK